MKTWALIILTSLSWLFAFDFVAPAQPAWQWAIIASAIGFAFLTRRGQLPGAKANGWNLVLVTALLLSLPLLETAYRPCVSVLLCGIFVRLIAGKRPLLSRLSNAAQLTGILLVAQAPMFWIYGAFTARNPEAPFFGRLIAPLLSFLGLPIDQTADVLQVNTISNSHGFPLTWNHLAGYPLLLIFVGAMVTQLLANRRRILVRFSALIAILAAYAVLRFSVVVTLFVNAMMRVVGDSPEVRVDLFWTPWVTAISMLPLIPIMAKFLPIAALPTTSAPRSSTIRPALAMTSIASFCMVFLNFFPDPGSMKQGRVMIEESKSDWEKCDREFDTDWYGSESGYNYWSLRKFLGHYYDVDRHGAGKLTSDKLSNCDILIVKTPTAEYSESEVQAIEDFVEKGGGLFLLGEHTNVFGSGAYINPIMRRFGMAFRYDCVFDVDRKWEQLHWPTKLGRHVAASKIPFFQFAVSCSIDADDWSISPIIRDSNLWSLPIDYAPGNFYPKVLDATHARFGAFDQMVARPFGKGRVVAFSDSTVFSNFSMFDMGKPELMLTTMDWLNRRNSLDWLRHVALIGFLGSVTGLFFIGFFRGRKRKGSGVRPIHLESFVLLGGTGLLTVVATLALCRVLQETSYPGPDPIDQPTEVVFDMKHGDFELPLFGFSQDFQNCYSIFYFWTSRLGYVPQVTFDPIDHLNQAEVMVVLHPKEIADESYTEALRQFVSQGGSLLVMERGGCDASIANSYLDPFDMRFSSTSSSSLVVDSASKIRLCEMRGGNDYYKSRGLLQVDGGTSLYESDRGEALVAHKRFGRGIVMAAGLAESFADPGMGGRHQLVPSEDQRALFEIQFTLLRALVTKSPSAEAAKTSQLYAQSATPTRPIETDEQHPVKAIPKLSMDK